jgi:transposase
MEQVAVVIGVDPHKRTHTMVAADELGRELASKTLATGPEGHLAALAWAQAWPVRRWALEDCRHLTRNLEADLLRAGEAVVRVPTRLMADARRSARTPGKSDPIDGLAVARAAWREPGLPAARLDGPSRQVRLLVDHREDLVRERSRLMSRIRWYLHEIAPELVIRPRALRTDRTVALVRRHLREFHGTLADICQETIDRIAELKPARPPARARDLGARRSARSVAVGHPGRRRADRCQDHRRDRRRGALSQQERLCPLEWHRPQPASSGRQDRFRLSRGGNRQVNAALHRIAVTQARSPSAGQDYYQRRISSGNTKTEALRLLRRRLSDVVFRTLRADETPATPTAPTPAPPRPRGRRARRTGTIICNPPLT